MIGGLGTRTGLLDLKTPPATYSKLGDQFRGGVIGSVKFDVVDAENLNCKPALSTSKLC